MKKYIALINFIFIISRLRGFNDEIFKTSLNNVKKANYNLKKIIINV